MSMLRLSSWIISIVQLIYLQKRQCDGLAISQQLPQLANQLLNRKSNASFDIFDAFRLYVKIQASQLRDCGRPFSFYYNGSCFYRTIRAPSSSSPSSHYFPMPPENGDDEQYGEQSKQVRRNGSSVIVLSHATYKEAQVTCAKINASLAVTYSPEEFRQVLVWITNHSVQSKGSSSGSSVYSHPKRQKIVLGVKIQSGILTWNSGDAVDDTMAPFSYSYERGRRLECPVLDLSSKGQERPMFITTSCEEQMMVICRKVVDRCHQRPCKRGLCINTLDSYVCKCPIMYTGVTCQYYSSVALQTAGGILLIMFGLIALLVNKRFAYRSLSTADSSRGTHCNSTSWVEMDRRPIMARSDTSSDPETTTGSLKHSMTSNNSKPRTDKRCMHCSSPARGSAVQASSKCPHSPQILCKSSIGTLNTTLTGVDESPPPSYNAYCPKHRHLQHYPYQHDHQHCPKNHLTNVPHLQRCSSPTCRNNGIFSSTPINSDHSKPIVNLNNSYLEPATIGNNSHSNDYVISMARPKKYGGPSSTRPRCKWKQRPDDPHSCFQLKQLIHFVAGSMSLIISISCTLVCYRSKLDFSNSVHQFIKSNRSEIGNQSLEHILKAKQNACQSFDKGWLKKVYKVPTSQLTVPAFAILTALVITCSRRRKHKWLCGGYGATPVVFNPFSKVNRFDSAAVFGILALEISHIFDEFIFHSYRYMSHGPLLDLLKQTGLVILLGARYFPILATFELRPPSALCFSFSACYMWIELVTKTAFDAMCISTPIDVFQERSLSSKIGNYVVKLKPYLRNLSSVEIMSNMSNGTGHQSAQHAARRALLGLMWITPDAVMFNVLKQFPYYMFSAFIACRLTSMAMISCFETAWPYIKCCLSYNISDRKSSEDTAKKEVSKPSAWYNQVYYKEHKYLAYLMTKPSERPPISLPIRLLCLVYDFHPYFAFSKQVINIYAISFTLIYYFTFWTMEHSHNMIDKVLRFVRFLFFYAFSMSLTEDRMINFESMKQRLKIEIISDLRIISTMTSLVCVIQLMLGLKHYQRQMTQAYRGLFEEIPSRRKFKAVTLVSKALHYPGYMVGYLIWGYMFLMGAVFISTILVRNLIRFLDIVEYIAKWIVPMVVLLLLKFLLIGILSRVAFTQQHGKVAALQNCKFMYVFNYFNFFFDCFLGLVMCVSRVSQASLAAVFLLCRLDYSMFGRNLERYDRGFAAYVSWIHLEEIQSHPVMVMFCELVRHRIICRRRFIMAVTSSQHILSVQSRADLNMTYSRRQAIKFRFFLLVTLANNEDLRKYRKHRLTHPVSFNDFSLRKIMTDTLKRIRNTTSVVKCCQICPQHQHHHHHHHQHRTTDSDEIANSIRCNRY